MHLKAVILIGGPQKGTRFRPVSFEIPKPLFPLAGYPTIDHIVEACCNVPDLEEIFILGFYQENELIRDYIASSSKAHNVPIRYLEEFSALGTAGGVYHFRDLICRGNPGAFFIIHGDVCGNFPLSEMVEFHRRNSTAVISVLATEAPRLESQEYGCIVEDKATHEILHYAEKPSTFVSTTINCGVYICTPQIFENLSDAFNLKEKNMMSVNQHFIEYSGVQDGLRIEQDVLAPLAGQHKAFAFNTSSWWSQIKTPSSAIYANRHYLELYHLTHPERLTHNATNAPEILGNVFIHPSANIHPSASVGPNVSIGESVHVGAGVRIHNSIVLKDSIIHEHVLIAYSIIGWNCLVRPWSRIIGTPSNPNPDRPFAKMENDHLFNSNGVLNPSITLLGSDVKVSPEIQILNSIVLPRKEITRSYTNEISL